MRKSGAFFRDRALSHRIKAPTVTYSRELEESDENLLRVVFENGKLLRPTTLSEIRERVAASLR